MTFEAAHELNSSHVVRPQADFRASLLYDLHMCEPGTLHLYMSANYRNCISGGNGRKGRCTCCGDSGKMLRTQGGP